jgi:hypothetical protein
MDQKLTLKSEAKYAMLLLMTTHATTQGNAKKVAQIEMALREMLEEALRRGFFGTAAIELNINDGTVQQIRRKVERVEK